MSKYLTIYNYKIAGDKINYPTSFACFGGLFRSLGDGVNAESLNVYMLRDVPHPEYAHKFEHSIEDISLVFESLKDIVPAPIITQIKSNEIPCEELRTYDGIDKFMNKDTVVLSFDLTGLSEGNIKVLATLCRYFYENYGTYSPYVDIMDNYISIIKNPRFNSIPAVELLQIAHMGFNCSGSHGLLGVEKNYPFDVIKEEEIKQRIKFKTYVNGSSGIFYNNCNCVKSIKFDFETFIEKYINENTSIRTT